MDQPSHLTRRRILSGAALAGVAPLAQAHVDGRSQPQLLRRPFKPADGGQERDYFLYVPTGFHTEAGREWPVMLFLHGGGERGNAKDELDHTLAHGPVMEAWIQGRDLPLTMVYETIADFRGDADRVYCTGLSFGGFGTWHIAQNHPERFAAVAPICGAGDPSKMQPIVDAKLPIWIHQGGLEGFGGS